MSLQHQLSNDDEFSPEEDPQVLEQADEKQPSEDNLEMRLRIVDHLLSTAPMLAPSVDFAERVMRTLRERQSEMNWSASTGLALGLSMFVLMGVGILLAGIAAIINLILNWTTVYQQLILGGGDLSNLVGEVIDNLQHTAFESPILPLLTLLSLPLFYVWLRVMRYLVPNDESA